MSQSKPESRTRPEEVQNIKALFIACAALGREVRDIIKKHGWNAEFQAIDARLHLFPKRIGEAVKVRLKQTDGRYGRRIVVYGHCGVARLDDILEEHGAVRPPGPHCYEMYGNELFAQMINEEPATYFLTDYLIRAWDNFVVRDLQVKAQPGMKDTLFRHFKRLVYFSQEEDEALVAQAQAIAGWMGLPLIVKHVGYGDLERRLVALMEGQEAQVGTTTS